MPPASFFAAIGTPLSSEEELDVEGLNHHLAYQWDGGMTGVLVAGTMGLMQLLTDQTYRQLIEHSVRLTKGRGEVMIGVGDTGFARTRDRIALLNQTRVDGVVVLSPFLLKFSQSELVDYFSALADFSKNALFLYDLPGLTGTKLELPTVLKLAKHGNIRGIKCSGDLGWTRQLMDLAPAGFRVIVAQAELVDVLLNAKVRDHLDGIFAVAPAWVAAIGRAAEANDFVTASAYQRKICELLGVVKKHGIFPSFTAILNAKGIPGNYAPAPLRRMNPAQKEELLAEPIVHELLTAYPGMLADQSAKLAEVPAVSPR